MTGKLLLLAAFTPPLVAQMVPVTTRAYDNARTGTNTHETILTQQSVIAKGVSLNVKVPLCCDARGMEAQPLIAPNVTTPKGVRDVMILPSMSDFVRAVDAHSGEVIWEQSLGTAIDGNKPTGPRKPKPDGCVGDFPTIDCHAINEHWGALSTGAIDLDTMRYYQVAWTSPDNSGNPTNARYSMFVLNVADGTPVAGTPVLIDRLDFNKAMRKARSSGVIINQSGVKTFLQCTGTVQETASGAAGYCFAFDLATNQFTAMIETTSGQGGGIWMGGQGLSCDNSGACFAITGNGDFDGQTQFGESLIRLQYTPPSGATPAALKITGHWTPWTDLQRAGKAKPAANRVAGMSLSSEMMKPVGAGMTMPFQNATAKFQLDDQKHAVVLVIPAMAKGAWSDEDWGSAGPACMFQLGVCIATGKGGIAYPVKTSNMGDTSPLDLTTPAKNCAKLAALPVWLTMSPGNVNPCPPDPASLNFLPWGDTAHLHMTPVQMFDPILNSWVIFAWGENAQLHKWAVSTSGQLKFVAQSKEFASLEARGNPPGGMPGGFCTGSSNAPDNINQVKDIKDISSTTAITVLEQSSLLVCAIPLGDANATVTQGRLLIYDPFHLNPDGTLKVLWDSQQWGWQFMHNKFLPPIVDGGEIIYPSYDGRVLIIGQ